jgi:hypothetical protein
MDTKSMRQYTPKDGGVAGGENDMFSAMQKKGGSLTRNDTRNGLAASPERDDRGLTSTITRKGSVAADIFSSVTGRVRSLTRNDTKRVVAQKELSHESAKRVVAQAHWKNAITKGQAVAKFTSKVAPLKPTEVSPQGGVTSDLDQ